MNPRRHNQIEKTLQVLNGSDTVAILKNDQHLLFCFKKTERIVTALYMLTSLFPEAEPLKWQLRDQGSLLLKDMLSFREHTTIIGKYFISKLSLALASMLSLLQIAYVSDMLSSANFSLLSKEISALIEITEKGRGSEQVFPSGPMLDSAFFGLPRALFDDSQHMEITHEPLVASISELERAESQKDILKGHTISVLNVREKKPKAKASVPTREKISQAISDNIRKQRERIILELLKKQATATVKDFSGLITGCSEKTVQRHLLAMVHTGVLKKDGERRWSRYSLARTTVGAVPVQETHQS